MTGLTAANALTARGHTVTILEKSRGVGGRMATRRTEAGSFDQGAQFLTARAHFFMRMVKEWTSTGLLQPWTDQAGEMTTDEDGAIRYVGIPSMTAVPKHLALHQHVLLRHRVLRFERKTHHWVIRCEGGTTVEAASIILTAPLPQSLQILEDSGLPLARAHIDEFRSISYNRCIVLMAALEGRSAVPTPGGILTGPEPVRWIADNHQRGIRTAEGTLTVHAGPAFSEAHYGDSDEDLTVGLLDAITFYLGSPVRLTQVHRWRYSEPRSTARQAAVLAIETPPLIVAGDAFGGPQVEGAALSGLAASDLLMSLTRGSSR